MVYIVSKANSAVLGFLAGSVDVQNGVGSSVVDDLDLILVLALNEAKLQPAQFYNIAWLDLIPLI